ncbi:hypothetical protein VrSk94_04100 [Vibrio rotiferianus]
MTGGTKPNTIDRYIDVYFKLILAHVSIEKPLLRKLNFLLFIWYIIPLITTILLKTHP